MLNTQISTDEKTVDTIEEDFVDLEDVDLKASQDVMVDDV